MFHPVSPKGQKETMHVLEIGKTEKKSGHQKLQVTPPIRMLSGHSNFTTAIKHIVQGGYVGNG